nr:hypothetical protein [Tanacetum cinerariifolium]
MGFSVFTTTSEDVEGRPTFHRFAKTNGMKAVPPPLTGDYTSLLGHTDLDKSQMSYGTKSSTSNDSESMTNDFSCDESDKSSEVKTSDFAFTDSSLKSSEHKPSDSSCASTSSVCTSVNKAENESNVGTPIQEPIIPERVRMGFSVFTITSEDVEGRPTFHSGIHLIKNCDFYEKQMANTTVGLGVGPAVRPQSVPTGKPTVTPVPTGKQKVKPVPTGKPHVFTPVPTGRPDRPLSVLTDRGYTPLVVLGNHIEKVYTGYLRTRVDLIHLHTDDNVADLLTKAFDEHRFNYLVVNIGMLNP